MLARRFALAFGLLLALFASQLPEYVQQYRQRLGGAVDELEALVARFDADIRELSLPRAEAIARLRGNPDPLAQERGNDIESTIARADKLQRQRADFAQSGPLSEYVVLLTEFDPNLARQAYGDFQPAVPVTAAGFVAGATGLLAGWGATHGLARFWRRRKRRRAEAREVLAVRRV